MLGLNDVTNSFKDSLMTGSSLQGNLFRQAAGDLAKTTVASKESKETAKAYENEVRIHFTEPQTNQSLQIPVLPADITIKWERQTETVNILNLGEVDFTTGRKLQGISFNSFFPLEYTPAYCRYADIPDPAKAYETLDAWCAGKNADTVPDKPVRLMIVGTSLNINMLVLITQLEMKDRGGSPGDLYYSISCREWREIKVRTEAEQRNRSTRSNLKATPQTILQKITTKEPLRETLYKIAKEQLGNGGSWTKILELNKEKLQGDLTKKAVSLVLR